MKKKILTKHILMALAMAVMVPAGQAWAADPEYTIEGDTITITTSKTVSAPPQDDSEAGKIYEDSEGVKHRLDEFQNVIINFNPSDGGDLRALGVYSARYGMENSNITVNVGTKDAPSTIENNDGLHLSNHYPDFYVRSYTANIYAPNSDALNLSHDITSTTDWNGGTTSMVYIGNRNKPMGESGNGNLTAYVMNGNGIRANASIINDITTGITVGGTTDITINGGEVTSSVTLSDEQVDKMIGDKHVGWGPFAIYARDQLGTIAVSAGYMPAAVYAGNDMYDFTCEASKLVEGAKGWEWASSLFGDMSMNLGNAAAGQGNIVLHDTNLTIQTSADGKEGGYGLFAGKNGHIQVDGNLTITSEAANSYGIAVKNANLIYGDSLSIEAETDGLLTMFGSSITSNLEDYPLDTSANTHGTSVMLGEGKDVSISMKGDNSYAMYAEGVDDTTEHKANSITGKELNTLYAVGDMLVENGGLIDLGTTGEKTDNNGNSWGAYQLGAVIASGTNKVSDTDIKKSTYSLSSANANYISSESVIADAGDLNTSTDDQFKNKSVISALYAEDGADIKVSSGQSNTFLTKADSNDSDQLERVIWAYNGADITVDGTTTISTDSYEKSANSADIAIAAGTAVNLTKENVENAVANPDGIDHAVVTVNYDSYADNEGNTVASSIKGDIVSAYAGQVDIRKTDDNAKINITGNLLAGNNGILNVDLGNGGVLEGRADDYGDAGVIQGSEHTKFFDPAFSSDIYKGGAVNLTMGKGSRWNVTGQSWITRIDTTEAGSAEDSGRAVIDLVSANTDRNETAHALTISEMKGDAVFHMSLDGNRDVSDMLYMKNAKGDYIINVVDPVTLDDMYAKRDNGELFNGLRFATVGKDSDVTFRAVTIDKGVLNVEYEVRTDSYDNNEENEEYNSTAEDGTASGNSEKPGDAMVDGFFESDGTPVGSADDTTSSANYMVLSEMDAEADTQNTGATNYKLIGRADEEISSAGKAIVAMSKVNYSNAVYMDRLNKRMGEARYIDGDDGLWVRLRHDRIGREDAFRSMNTMFELGYDRKVQDQKDGEHRRGVAFDYMRGEADYTTVMGSGDVRRAGVWLYDTWLGDKGHYSDYVLKYGRLSNDFDIFAPTTADKISGDYDNDVWSASAEYGRKKDIGNEWYFEPQAQLQYAYVTSADYTTSQNTKVSLDGIDSLIGRAGFRLGRDTSEGNTVYFKADILHEFLGDQRVHASDITGTLDTTYDNEGTWYDVGLGFSHRMGEDSYMFLDVEHSFGNDNEDTYQINIGLNRAF